jgi:hypothetical protein
MMALIYSMVESGIAVKLEQEDMYNKNGEIKSNKEEMFRRTNKIPAKLDATPI